VDKAPAGEGAASNWVMRRYHDVALPLYRKVCHQTRLVFFIVVDGDNVGCAGRLKALDANGREDSDRIVLLAPTWSIETWILWLNGEEVSESEQTKQRLSDSQFRERMKTAVGLWEAPPRTGELSSLATARIELKRIHC